MSEIKRLYRSRSNRMLGGVAAGLGEYFAIDPTLVRLLFVFAFMLWCVGPLFYLVMWFIVPEEPAMEVVPVRKARSRKTE